MKTKQTEINLGAYVTPEIKSLEIKSEGVLCASPDTIINPWENDGDSLNF